MRTLPAMALSTLLTLGSVAGAVAFVDAVLPAQVIEAEVWNGIGEDAGRVYYIVPLSGGVLEWCPVETKRLPAGQGIVVRRSQVLGRCLGVATR